MCAKKFDYAVLGQGAAAFAAAIRANELGKKTVLIGKNATSGTILGGTCVNVGCVPSKRMISAGEFASDFRERKFSGINFSEPQVDYSKIAAEKNAMIKKMQHSKYQDVIEGLKSVTYINELGQHLYQFRLPARQYSFISLKKRDLCTEPGKHLCKFQPHCPASYHYERLRSFINRKRLLICKVIYAVDALKVRHARPGSSSYENLVSLYYIISYFYSTFSI